MEPGETDSEQMPLGALQKGAIDILDAKVTIAANPDAARSVVVVPSSGADGNSTAVKLEWLVRIESDSHSGPFEVRTLIESIRTILG